jgi:methionine-rich copper-binding protein CopC
MEMKMNRALSLHALALAAALAIASPAMAQHHDGSHTGMTMDMNNMLTSSTPANGAVLKQAPRTLTLVFSHPVTLQTVAITGPGDARVAATFRRPNAPKTSYAIALPQLTAGAYSAKWSASGGGHKMEGAVGFSVQ